MIHLGSVGGTTIDIDVSFLFIVGLWVVSDVQQTKSLKVSLLWAPVLLIGVLVHELAHAGVIGAFGYGSSHIILRGIGGVTINQRNARPWQNVLISLAGPVASFGLAAAALGLYAAIPALPRDPMMKLFIPLFASANILWGKFNLLPVAPLDGGHAVRDFLRIFLKDSTALTLALVIAVLAGGAFAVWMLLRGQFLVALFVGWFVMLNFQQWQYFRKNAPPGE